MSALKFASGFVFALAFINCDAQPAAADPSVFPNSFFAPLDISGSIPVSITNMTGAGSSAAAADQQLAVWAMRDWSRALHERFRFHIVESENEALVRIRFVGPGGGQYGEMARITVDGKSGAAVFVRPDTQALGPVIARRAGADALFRETIVYLTCLHEFGHALGLAHTAEFADIMYAFGYGGDIEEYFLRYRRKLSDREDIATQSGLSQSDIERVRALYSGDVQ